MAGPLDSSLRLPLSDSLSVTHGAFFYLLIIACFLANLSTQAHCDTQKYAFACQSKQACTLRLFIRLYLLACVHI